MRSHSQTLDAVKSFIDRWKGRGYEKGESQQFWTDLLHDVLDIETPSEIISFENQVKLASTSFIDAYIAPTKVLIEQKSIDKDLRKAIKQSDGSLLNPFQQAKRYAAELPVSKHPRWVVTCNFKSFLIYDMENPHGEPEEVLLENLEKDYYRLRFLVEDGKAHLKRELEISIKAGELVGKLYDAFLKQYQTSPTPSVSLSADISPSPLHSGEGGEERTTPRKSKTQSPPLQHGEGNLGGEISAADLHSLNVLCVRLVFCLYAEDAGIFSKDQFYYYMAQYKPSQMRVALRELFTVLDTKVEDRDRFLDKSLKDFPYVNGSLFHQNPGEDIPQFDEAMSELLLKEASLGFDWSEISPTIFGAVFESTLNPETRRSGGMHYTSIENIHKVIDPLFLNDLKAEFEKIKEEKQDNKRKQKLEAFQDKLASLTFLDPACGSGNFLTETYISLRRLENEAISLKFHGQKLLGLEQLNPIKVNIHQFYGIEINDFAVTVATTALWIAESQMMHETERIIKFDLDYLPLKSFTNIHLGNALRMDWNDLTRPQSGHPFHSGEGNGPIPPTPFPVGAGGDGPIPPTPFPVGAGGANQRSYATSDPKMWNTLKERAREHRNNPTEAEEILWKAIRNNQLGCKFRRQQAIHVYIADFVCLDLKLIIEVDGGYHEEENQRFIDEQRTYDLSALGYRVVRFTNEEILDNLPSVIQQLQSYITEVKVPRSNEEGGVPRRTILEMHKVPRPNGEGDLGGGANFDYIMGNPPFVGYAYQSKEQKDDLHAVCAGCGNNIDYVAGWYYKSAHIMQNTTTRAALVSTNSITQGEQVEAIWRNLFEQYNVSIDFAHRTFRWDSEATIKAHVHCVVIGFSCIDSQKDKCIYDDMKIINCDNINPYLLNAPTVFISKQSKPLCNVPAMIRGSSPIDDGNLLLTIEEKDAYLNREPQAEKFIRPFMMGKDFIDRKPRYCFWLVGANPSDIKKCPELCNRIELVREFRMKSAKGATRNSAETPTLFGEMRPCDSDYIAIPKVSSERRRYIPIEYLKADILAGDKLFQMQNASLYHFGVLNSNVHMAWMRAVCGRLKSDYSYSNTIVYNNFPWPTPTDAQKAKIEQTAQAILDARSLHPDCSLAVLYDEVTMPPELRKAHQNNDRAVMEAYGFDWRTMTESECVAELFKLYQKLTSPTPSVSLSADISPSPLHSGEGGGERKTPRKSKTQSPPLQHGEGDLGGEVTKRTRKEEKHD